MDNDPTKLLKLSIYVSGCYCKKYINIYNCIWEYVYTTKNSNTSCILVFWKKGERLNSFVQFLFHVFSCTNFWRDNCSIFDIQRKSKFSTPKFIKKYSIVLVLMLFLYLVVFNVFNRNCVLMFRNYFLKKGLIWK